MIFQQNNLIAIGFTWLKLGIMLLLVAMVGCNSEQDEELETEYGEVRGNRRNGSVNGTAVLAEMFAQQGFKVTSRNKFSPIFNAADVVVWFPGSFEGPTEEARSVLNDWLESSGQPRTLVYVGRDYDAEILYWKTMMQRAGDDDKKRELYKTRWEKAKRFFEYESIEPETDFHSPWFRIDVLEERENKVKNISGSWAAEVDANEAQIELQAHLEPTGGDYDDVKILLETEFENDFDTKTIAFSKKISTSPNYEFDDYFTGDESQLIVISNGSFLLNLALVNHQHRILAQHLIDEVKQHNHECNLIFLESPPSGLQIYEKEPMIKSPSIATVFQKPPLSYWTIHLAILAVIFFFSMWPIFGRPKRIKEEGLSDFGAHVEALGRLLNRTQDKTYAWQRIKLYRQKVKGDSGEHQTEET